jgi:hypothetical protein
MHPSPLLWRPGDDDAITMSQSFVKKSEDLNGRLKRLFHVPSARSYLAEFVCLAPGTSASLWMPKLRLMLTDTDKSEAPEAPDIGVVSFWLEGSLQDVRIDDFVPSYGPMTR